MAQVSPKKLLVDDDDDIILIKPIVMMMTKTTIQGKYRYEDNDDDDDDQSLPVALGSRVINGIGLKEKHTVDDEGYKTRQDTFLLAQIST